MTGLKKLKYYKLCDIEATFQHLLDTKKKMQKKEFEELVTKINCYKYKRAPKLFLLKYKRRKHKKNKYRHTDTLKWDWIRRKRAVSSKEELNTDDKNKKEYYKKNTQKYRNKLLPKKNSEDLELVSNKKYHKEDSKDELKDTKHTTDAIIGKVNDELKSDAVLKKSMKMYDEEYYETFERDEYGIYRRKRSLSDTDELAAVVKKKLLPKHVSRTDIDG
jgi:hypothetical protein